MSDTKNDFDGELNPEFWRHKAETSQKLSCPSCGAPLPESWRTDDVTSDSDGNDEAGPPLLSIILPRHTCLTLTGLAKENSSSKLS